MKNTFSVPDYYRIEIKARRTYSKSTITLFSVIPNGENLFEIERLKETYDNGLEFAIEEYNLPKLFYKNHYTPYPKHLLNRKQKNIFYFLFYRNLI